MEESVSDEQKKANKEAGDELVNCVMKFMGLTKKPKLPNFPINKKAQKKFLKEPFKHKNNIDEKNIEETSEKDKKEIVKKMIYPSGIIKTITKNEKNQIIDENVDYTDIKPNYINYLKENLDKELIKLIENSFLLYNRKQIIRNIVKKPYSTKTLEEKILLWKYYIKNSTKDEKALLLRKLLYYIGKFSEKIYDEFIKIKDISKAYFIFLLKGKIDKEKPAHLAANQFYMMSSLFGYDSDGNPIKEERSKEDYHEELNTMLLMQHQILNIKEELNGTGFGLIFLKELREIADMYSNTSYIFKSIFYECFDIFDIKEVFVFEKIEIYRIMWNFFSDYFIDDSFIINFLIQLKFIFATYKQDDVVKFMHDLVLYRWNTHRVLERIRENLEKMLGPEEIYDEKEKVEKMNNDDVMKYIEGDEKTKKKKKKKKKKNEDKINLINQLEQDYKNNNKINNDYDDIDNYDNLDIDNDDSISIISEADSILNSFKNDIIEETEFNTGNKIIPQLSSQFLNLIQK